MITQTKSTQPNGSAQPNGSPQTIAELYPSKWLKAPDLPPTGRVATIARWAIEEFRQPNNQNEPALVLYFVNATKALICNKTQLRAIAEITGSERFADWVGARLHLKPALAANKKPTISVTRPVDHL